MCCTWKNAPHFKKCDELGNMRHHTWKNVPYFENVPHLKKWVTTGKM